MHSVMLTERRKEILGLLTDAARQGMGLSVRDLCEALHLRSPATVYVHLSALARDGYVSQVGRSRRYRVLCPPGIPIAGRIQAGAPIENPQQGPEGELLVEPSAFAGRGDFVALKVVGDSMCRAGIFDGDYVIVRRQQRVENGEIAAVLVNGGGTLKRVHARGNRVVLKPESSRFAPITLDDRSDVRIYGKLVAVLRGDLRTR